MRLILSIILFILASVKSWDVYLQNKRIKSLDIKDSTIIVATDEGLFLGNTNADTFEILPFNGTAEKVSVWKDMSELHYYVVADGNLFHKSGENDEWKRLVSEYTVLDISISTDYIAVAVRNSMRTAIYVSSDKMLRSSQLKAQFPTSKVYLNDNILYSYGSPGTVGIGENLGSNWRHHTMDDLEVRHIYANNQQLLMATSSFGILRSFDRGRNYSFINRNNYLGENDTTCVIVLPDDTMIVGTRNKGLFYSVNSGESFNYKSIQGYRNFPSNEITSLSYVEEGSRLYVGTGAGLVVLKQIGEALLSSADIENQNWVDYLSLENALKLV